MIDEGEEKYILPDMGIVAEQGPDLMVRIINDREEGFEFHAALSAFDRDGWNYPPEVLAQSREELKKAYGGMSQVEKGDLCVSMQARVQANFHRNLHLEGIPKDELAGISTLVGWMRGAAGLFKEQDVIGMLKAKVPQESIVEYINNSPWNSLINPEKLLPKESKI